MFTTGADPYGAFQPAGTPLYAATRDGVQPRIGVAWDVTGSQKTIVRGGFGIYRVAVPPFFIWNTATIDPRLPVSATYTPVDAPGLAYPLSGRLLAAYQDPFVAVAQGLAPAIVTRTVVDPARRDPLTRSWNLTVERQFGDTLAVEAGYVGTRTVHALNSVALNLIDPATKVRPDPSIGQINLSTSSGRRDYDALQLALRKRLGRGLAANVSYTLSRSTMCGGEDSFGPSGVQNWADPEHECGRNNLDVPHALETDISYQIPTAAWARDGLWRPVLGGWSVSGMLLVRSGYPVNILTGRDIRGNGLSGTQRADYVGGSLYPSDQTYLNWFNKDAFANPAAGQFGTIAYNAARGPAFAGLNASVAKAVALASRHALTIRLDVFNVLNRVNFLFPDANINSATFGRITATESPRQAQVSLRYQF
jgi:hypothetical protein